MAYRDLDFNLTDEQTALRDTIRKFGSEVMRPAGEKLDKLADPSDVIAKGSALWDVFRKYHELGFHRRGIPKALGGMMEDMDPVSNLLIGEEMGYADAGWPSVWGPVVCPLPMQPFFPIPSCRN